VIVAAGRGERLGRPKQFLVLGDMPLLLWSVRAFREHPGIECVVVVLPVDDAKTPPDWLPKKGLRVCAGGETRRESAGQGVIAVPAWADVILIHDAARPFVTQSTIDAVLAGAAGVGAALPVVPLSDTVKRLSDDRVEKTLDRERLGRAQTPQGFRADWIREAHSRADRDGLDAPDDAALVESLGRSVLAVPGETWNLKITTPEDFELAEWLVRTGRVARVPGADGPYGEV
jgi:2-C-methyl-D-erythritol 4-phosphate cytidylyltransferase